MKLFATLLAGFWVLHVHGQELIWSVEKWAENSGAQLGQSWQIAFDHTPVDATYPPSQNPATRIFFMPLTTTDSGRTFFADATSDPGFEGFVAGLSDGANGYLRFQDGAPNSWQPWSEQNFLGRSSVAPDLAGYNITQIGFRVNNFYDYFDEPENRYFRHLDYSLDFYGAPVPEPSTWALLSLGAAALLIRRKVRKQSCTAK